jgi:hypothetical protein
MTYATLWTRCWLIVGAVGVGLSFLAWSPADVATVFVTATLCVGVLLVLATTPADDGQLLVLAWARLFQRAMLAGGAVVAIGAVIAVLPYLALPLLGLAVVSSPWSADRIRTWRRRASAGAGPAGQVDAWPGQPGATETTTLRAVAPLPTTEDHGLGSAQWSEPTGCRLDVDETMVRQLSDRELCLEWRRSFVTLQAARSAGHLLRVVTQRQIYLDEMERRSPTALAAWLSSGARAAGGPERFLDGRSDVA